jgi:hypothetical protein
MEVVGWSRIVFDRLGIDPPQFLMTGRSDAHYRLDNLYHSAGLDRRQFWTHYAWLTAAGMGGRVVCPSSEASSVLGRVDSR